MILAKITKFQKELATGPVQREPAETRYRIMCVADECIVRNVGAGTRNAFVFRKSEQKGK